jgi:Carboxypeptidase regulatory-like domain/TonB dependent receptor
MKRFSITLFAVLFLLVPLAFSQTMTTGDVTGVTTDTSGAVLPGATVTIKSVDTNETRTATTNAQGEYRFPLMHPGDYTISAVSSGMASTLQRFTLLVSQEQAMNLTLGVKSTQQTVEVTADASAVQTENANLATSFGTKQVNTLPFNGGDLTTVAMTVPGVLMGGTVGGSGSANIVANGISGAAVLYTMNGADDMDPYLNINNSGASNNLLGQNEVAEASVVLNAYSSEFGRMTAAQVNYVGKTGSNGFHGNLSYQYNTDGFNANDFFFNSEGVQKARAVANYPAASLGGPIKKNKLFFFTNYESLRYSLPGGFNNSIPSPQLQSYILTQIPAASLPLYQQAFGLWNNAVGVSHAQPVTTGNGPLQDSTGRLGCGTNGTFTGTHGPNGEIFGVNTPCAYSWGSAVSEYNAESLVTIRADWNISDKNKINFRYNYDWGVQATGPSPIASVFNSTSTQPSDQGQLNDTYIISPNLVNNFIGSGSWYTAIFGVQSYKAAQAAIPETIAVTDGTINAGGGFDTVGAGVPNGRNVGQLQLVDDLSWTKGKHNVKVGINYRMNKVTDTSIASGSLQGTYTLTDITDFANAKVDSTGLNSQFSQSFPTILAAHIRLYSLGFYAQDEWAVTKNLKLTLGIRFERDGDPACLDNCFQRFNPTTFGSAAYTGGLSVPYNATIQSGLHNEFASIESVVPEPRFGFAWSPFGNSKTVIRGGVGLFANLFQGSTAATFFDQAPGKYTPTALFGNVGLASDPASSAFAAASAANVFFPGFAAGDTLGQLQTALGKVPFAVFNYTQYPNNYVVPKEIEWSFEVQQSLTTHDVFAVTYTGNHGYDLLFGNSDANAYISIPKNYPNGFGGLPLVEPDPRFKTVTVDAANGVQNYDALAFQLRHAISHGLQAQAGYTWSHDLGTVAVENPADIGAGYGSLAIDRRQAFTADLTYIEPFRSSNHFINGILGGWTLGAKFFAYTGRPFSATDSKLAARISPTEGITPLADVIVPSASGTTCGTAALNTQCLVASDFAGSTVQNDFGNVAPDSFRGPGYFDIDTQALKGFRIKERYNFQVGAQFYNVLNHPNFANPSGSVTSGGLGLITSDVSQPTSIYGSGQGAIVSGRVIVLTGKFTF